jgi:hypothetical protein
MFEVHEILLELELAEFDQAVISCPMAVMCTCNVSRPGQHARDLAPPWSETARASERSSAAFPYGSELAALKEQLARAVAAKQSTPPDSTCQR